VRQATPGVVNGAGIEISASKANWYGTDHIYRSKCSSILSRVPISKLPNQECSLSLLVLWLLASAMSLTASASASHLGLSLPEHIPLLPMEGETSPLIPSAQTQLLSLRDI